MEEIKDINGVINLLNSNLVAGCECSLCIGIKQSVKVLQQILDNANTINKLYD